MSITTFEYGLNARPAMLGTIPQGQVQIVEDDSRAQYGVVVYERELTQMEVDDYELLNLNLSGLVGLTQREAYMLLNSVRKFVDQFDLPTLRSCAYEVNSVSDDSEITEKTRLTSRQWQEAAAIGCRYFNS